MLLQLSTQNAALLVHAIADVLDGVPLDEDGRNSLLAMAEDICDGYDLTLEDYFA